MIQPEDMTINTNAHFNVATSWKNPVHILTFLQQNLGNPAIKVSSYSLTTACTLSYLSTEFISEVESPSTSLYPGST